ncbi:MAG: hypothetical protein AAF653_20330, partial [Chloroflexota bacterium]
QLDLRPDLTTPNTTCTSPFITNGDFSDPIGSEYQVFNHTSVQNPSGILEMTLTTAGQRARIQQQSQIGVAANSVMRARFNLGNTGSQTKKVIVVIVDRGVNGDIENDGYFCTFFIPGNTPLQGYTMTIRTAVNWANASVRIMVEDSTQPALRVDNLQLDLRPDLSVSGTTCGSP